MGLRAMVERSASAVLSRRRAPPVPASVAASSATSGVVGNSQRRHGLSLSNRSRSSDASAAKGDATDSDDDSGREATPHKRLDMAPPSATHGASQATGSRAGKIHASMADRAARLRATAAARITRLVGENPPMGSSARVVRKQYQSIVKEREKEYKEDDKGLIDAVALYEIEFPKQPGHASCSSSESAGSASENYPLGIDLETDFYGKHTVVKEVKRGSVAYALYKSGGSRVLKSGHIVVAVNGHDLSRLSFQEVLQELKTAGAPRVIRFLDPSVLPFKDYKHEAALVNRDQYGFAKDDRYILNYRRQLRKRKLTGYEHERRWAEFVQQQGGFDTIDRLLHDDSADPSVLKQRDTVLSELRTLVLKGIPAVLRSRVWGVLTGVSPYRSRYADDYYPQLVSQIEFSPSVGDIEKDIHRTYPEHPFFQSDQGRRELKNVLGAYSLHNLEIGYCQSMNFIAGMMVLFMNEEDAFWLFSAIMEKRYLPAENYTQSMVGTQTDQLVFKQLVSQELPVLAGRLDLCGIQIQLVTLHWFLCAFVCTLPTESALRVWDWFFLDGQEVLFVTAIGILKRAEPRILAATTHSDLHTIVRELGTDLHDDDAFMAFLYEMAPPSEILRREEEASFDKAWEFDDDDSGDSSSSSSSSGSGSGSSSGASDDDSAEEEQEPLEENAKALHPQAAWSVSSCPPVKAKSRKRTLKVVPQKLHGMLQHFIESQRKDSRSNASATYQRLFTMHDVEVLRSEYRPQFDKPASASS